MSIHFIKSTALVSDTEFQNAVADINTQLANEFAFTWGLTHFPASLTLVDSLPDPGALGYHDIDSQHQPFAVVNASFAQLSGIPWSVVASHEALEMAANPLVNRLALLDTSGGAGTSGELVWAEICDAVERGSYPGRLHQTPLSNFVLPGWFVPGWQLAVDHLGKLPGPLTTASGGSFVAESFTGQGWQDFTAFLVQTIKKRKVHYL